MSAYLGYRGSDGDTPWGRFFDADMAPLASHVTEALAHGPQPEPLLTDRNELDGFVAGDDATENGYAVCRDGSIRVAVSTPMPGVTPAMWNWWFGWHGSDDRRYKLWHPRAHLSAAWADGDDREGYLGRTSIVREYLGSTRAHASIRFVTPAEVGIHTLAPDDVAICARLGDATRPVDVGWLVHHVRPTSDGAEMRSRFWLGGEHISVRAGTPARGVLDRAGRPVVARLLGASAQSAVELLVHCAQEMSHLARFLPELHADLAEPVRMEA